MSCFGPVCLAVLQTGEEAAQDEFPAFRSQYLSNVDGFGGVVEKHLQFQLLTTQLKMLKIKPYS